MVSATLVQTGASDVLPVGLSSRAQLMREVRGGLVEGGFQVPAHMNRIYMARMNVPIGK